jgi:hypothetical protein
MHNLGKKCKILATKMQHFGLKTAKFWLQIDHLAFLDAGAESIFMCFTSDSVLRESAYPSRSPFWCRFDESVSQLFTSKA